MTTPTDTLSPSAQMLVTAIRLRREQIAREDGVFVEEGPGESIVSLILRFNGRVVQRHTYDKQYESDADLARYWRALERKLSQLQRRHLQVVG